MDPRSALPACIVNREPVFGASHPSVSAVSSHLRDEGDVGWRSRCGHKSKPTGPTSP